MNKNKEEILRKFNAKVISKKGATVSTTVSGGEASKKEVK